MRLIKSCLKQPLVLCTIFIGSVLYASPEEHLSCSSSEISRRECRLKGLGYDLYFNWEKVRINNGVWRAIVEIPNAQKKSKWKKVRFLKLNDRYFVELLVWEEPQSEVLISNLAWHLLEVEGVKAQPVFSKTVQKRRKLSQEKNEFQYDMPEKFGLLEGNTKKVKWHLGHQSGEF